MNLLILFAQRFTSETSAMLIPVAILAWAFVLYVWNCRKPYLAVLHGLKQTRKILANVGGAEDFANRFAATCAELRASPWLRRAWAVFERHLQVDEAAHVVLADDEVSNFIEPVALLEQWVDTRWLATIPNLLTGIGILGTFLGLACGILLAKDGLVSHDSTRTTAALESLFGGAAVAFWKSVAGLVASMLFVWRERRLNRLAIQELEEIVGILSGWVQVVTPNQLLRRQFELHKETQAPLVSLARDQLEVLREQSNQLKNFNARLVVSLQEALDEAYAKRMQTSFKEILEHVERLGDTFRSSLSQGLGGNVDVKLSGIDELRGALTTLAPTLESSRRELEGSTRLMVQEVAALMSSTRSTAEEQLKTSAGTMDATVKSLAEKTSEQVSQVQLMLTEMREASARIVHQMEVSAAQAQSTGQERLAEQTRILEGTMKEILGAAAQMTEQIQAASTRAQTASQENFAQLSQEVAGTLKASGSQMGADLEKAGQALARQTQEQGAQIAAATAKLESIIERWAGAMASSNEFATGMSKLVIRLDDSQSGFQTASTALTTAARELSSVSAQIRSFGQSSDAAVERFERIQSVIATATEQCSKAWDDYRTRFEGIDQSLAHTFEQFNGGLLRCQQIVQQFMKEVDQHLSKAIKGLESVVGEMSEGIVDLPEQVKHMGAHVLQLRDSMDQLRKTLPETRR